MIRWLIEITGAQMEKVQVEFFENFAEVYYFRGVDGHLIGHFHKDTHRKAVRKKAGKFARKYARKRGGLPVEKVDHTKEART